MNGKRPDQSIKLGVWSKVTIIAFALLLFVGFGIIVPMKAEKERSQREHGSCQQFRAEDISHVPARCVEELTHDAN